MRNQQLELLIARWEDQLASYGATLYGTHTRFLLKLAYAKLERLEN